MANRLDSGKPKVALLYGGASEESEISKKSAKETHKALISKGFEVEKVLAGKDLVEKLKAIKPDVAFLAMHGGSGEDGTVQSVLDVLGIAYTGSGVLASSIAMHKTMAKRLFLAKGIATPSFITTRKGSGDDVLSRLNRLIGFPVVVKPASQGSTIGLSIVKNERDLPKALGLAFQYDNQLLIEQFIEGTEITVGVLGNDDPIALPTLEITTKTNFYDYKTKYTKGLSSHIIPARIEKKQRKQAKRASIAAHKALGCKGFSRADFICPKGKDPLLLEVNTIPGLTRLSLFPDAAKAAGISFENLAEKLIELALQK